MLGRLGRSLVKENAKLKTISHVTPARTTPVRDGTAHLSTPARDSVNQSTPVRDDSHESQYPCP